MRPNNTLPSSIENTLHWWESKRKWYNIIVIIPICAIMGLGLVHVLIFGIFPAILLTIAYLLTANCFYSLGWGFEILLSYYFKEVSFSNHSKWIAFTLGSIFSVFLTLILYSSTLIAAFPLD